MTPPPATSSLEIRTHSHIYKVLIGENLLDCAGAEVIRNTPRRAGARCAVVTDDRVAPLYADRVMASLRQSGFMTTLVTVPAGERSKSLERVTATAEDLIAAGLDRGSFLVTLGGGVVGDLAGFLASIYHRGIPYVQIPTTIVSQVDSAIGGKTGVNTVSGKNLLGTFYPPALVLVDPTTLATLPPREFNEGFAEVIKHGVIRDRTLLDQLCGFDRSDNTLLSSIIRRNLEIKADVVAYDEYERLGVRALLNFGHTIGHGIEQAGGYGRFLHGEAVALGMAAAARLSVLKAGLPRSDGAQIIRLLRQFLLPTVLPPDMATDAILSALAHDKKFEESYIRFVLIPRLGEARLSSPGEVTLTDLRQAIEHLRSDAE